MRKIETQKTINKLNRLNDELNKENQKINKELNNKKELINEYLIELNTLNNKHEQKI